MPHYKLCVLWYSKGLWLLETMQIKPILFSKLRIAAIVQSRVEKLACYGQMHQSPSISFVVSGFVK